MTTTATPRTPRDPSPIFDPAINPHAIAPTFAEVIANVGNYRTVEIMGSWKVERDAQAATIARLREALRHCAFSLEAYIHQTGGNAGKMNLEAARAALVQS